MGSSYVNELFTLLVIDRFSGKYFVIHEGLKFGRIFGCLGAEAKVHADTVRILGQI